MSLILGWLLAGALGVGIAAAIVVFWDEIKSWLNNVAADVVERTLGYNARQNMYRAITRIDRVMDIVRNRTVVYYKKNHFSDMYDKVTLGADAKCYDIDSEVLDEIKNKNELVQEFIYRK